ncbi:MAG: Ig-like domain-containing protein [Planctomycetes bacterium]|nr:Ig-like domain-containing protein [Planctomycetota bacterium]
MTKEPILRAAFLLLLASTAAASEAPTMDPIAPMTMREDEGLAADRTIIVTGIGPAGVTVDAGTADSALVRIQAVAFDAVAGIARIELDPQNNAHGSTLVYVSASDASGAAVVRICRLSVTPQPDPPFLFPASITPRSGQTVAITDSHLRVEDADQPPDSELVLSVTRTAQVGDLLLDGATVVGAGGTFTVADLQAGRLTFRHNGRSDIAFDQLYCTVTDGVFPARHELYLGIWTSPGQPPQIALGSPPGPWIEGGGAVPVCPEAVFTDADTLSFSGLHLTVSLDAEQARAGDALEFRHAGSGAGQIAVDGQALAFEGHPIGSWAGGVDGQPLVVTFANQESGPAAVQALLRALRYRHTGRDPGADRRLIQVVAEDHVSGPSAPASVTLPLQLVDDPPGVATVAIGTLAGVARTLQLVASDPDSSAFTWAITAQPQVAELTLLDPAAGLLRIVPRPGLTGTDRFTVTLSDRVNPPVAATIALRITGFDDPRPQPLADPPFAAVAGELLRADIPWDAVVAVTAAGEVPAGLVLTPLSATSVRLEWTLPVAEPPGLRAFALLATSLSDHATGRMPVLLRVLPRPGGMQ